MPGTSPNNTGVVASSRYTLVYDVRVRAKALLTSVVAHCDAKIQVPKRSSECRRRSQKGNPINHHHRELASSFENQAL